MSIALVRNALAAVGDPYTGAEAECMLLAIGYQESGFATRVQLHGPARGFWQFEIEAVRDFIDNGMDDLRTAASASGVMLETSVFYTNLAFAKADTAACLAARDLLWRASARPLPSVGEEDEAWQQYIHAWRPGKPSRHRWSHAYAKAKALLA